MTSGGKINAVGSEWSRELQSEPIDAPMESCKHVVIVQSNKPSVRDYDS